MGIEIAEKSKATQASIHTEIFIKESMDMVETIRKSSSFHKSGQVSTKNSSV